MHQLEGVSKFQQNKILSISTLAFTVCFAVWTIFSILGISVPLLIQSLVPTELQENS